MSSKNKNKVLNKKENTKKKSSEVIRSRPIPLKKVYPEISLDKFGPKKFTIVYVVYLVMVIIIIIVFYFVIKKQIEDKTCPDGTIINMDGKGCSRIIITEQYEGIINDKSKCNVGYIFDVKTSKCIKESEEINNVDEQDIIGCASPKDIFTSVPSNKRDKNAIGSNRCRFGDTKVCIKPCYPGYKMFTETKTKQGNKDDYINHNYTTYICKFENICNKYKKFKGTDLEDPNICLFK